VACVEPAKGWTMPSGVGGRSRSRGWRDGEGRGDESTKEDALGEPPGDEEGDMYARSSGLMKAICRFSCKFVRMGVSM
jgi:hypothetical protein